MLHFCNIVFHYMYISSVKLYKRVLSEHLKAEPTKLLHLLDSLLGLFSAEIKSNLKKQASEEETY